MEQKIILKKRNDKAVFLYRNLWSDGTLEIQFVIGTLQDKDINKKIGETITD